MAAEECLLDSEVVGFEVSLGVGPTCKHSEGFRGTASYKSKTKKKNCKCDGLVIFPWNWKSSFCHIMSGIELQKHYSTVLNSSNHLRVYKTTAKCGQQKDPTVHVLCIMHRMTVNRHDGAMWGKHGLEKWHPAVREEQNNRHEKHATHKPLNLT